jgi:hypothetical protein
MCRMESGVRTPVEEKKDQAGNPAESVAQQCCQILG